MPNPTWPAALPVSWGGGAVRDRQENTVETAMDVGPPKRRRTATADFIATRFSFVVTLAQKGELETFYATTLKKVLPFDWNDFSTTGSPVRTFRFASAPSYQHRAGGSWIATLELEQLP